MAGNRATVVTTNIIKRDGQEVSGEHTADGKSGEIRAGSYRGLGIGRHELRKKTGADVVHIGDAVLIAADNKGHDGEENGQNLSGDILCRGCHKYGDADEDIAQDSGHEGGAEGQIEFTHSDLDGEGAH